MWLLAILKKILSIFKRKINMSELIPGIDVSSYQENIDWDKVRDEGKIKFAIVKAVDDIYEDRYFKKNQIGARRTMERVGYYHFLTPRGDIIKQAKRFLDVVGNLQSNEFLVLDIERKRSAGLYPEEVQNAVSIWFDFVDRESGRLSWYYTSIGFAKMYNIQKVAANHPLWILSYTNKPKQPPGWDKWFIWQYTDIGNVPGIKGKKYLNWADSNWYGHKFEIRF